MIRGSAKENAKRERARKVRGCWVLCGWEGLEGLTCDFRAENGERKINYLAYDTPILEEFPGSRADQRITIPIARAIATFMRIIPKLPARSDPGNMKSLPRNTAFSVMPGSKEKMYCQARKSLTKMMDGSQIGAFFRVNVLVIPPCYLVIQVRRQGCAGGPVEKRISLHCGSQVHESLRSK
jgi:hypothetical protein